MSSPARIGGDGPAATRAGSAKVIGLVSAGHFLSHFYMLMLAPLLPILREVYGVGFTELGLAVSVYSVTTGIIQAPVGFLVDRFGARAILIAGLVLESVAMGLIGVFPTYAALLALMVLAGIANAVFHPADYAILNASVHPERMGRAFSIHTFAGYMGNALAPVTMVFLLSLLGWRNAVAVAGLAGGAVALLIWANSALLRDASGASGDAAARAAGAPGQRRGLALLFSLPVVMGMLFFIGLSMTGRGISEFGVSVLTVGWGAPLSQAGLVVSAYLFAAPLGVLLGGWVADRVTRHDRVAGASFVVVGLALFAVAAFAPPLELVALLFCVAGLFSGLVAPSRDMLIRAVTPPGEMGKVFGFVSTGYNIGGIVAPVLFGYLLDNAEPRLVFWVAGAVSLITVFTVMETGRQGRRGRGLGAPAPQAAAN